MVPLYHLIQGLSCIPINQYDIFVFLCRIKISARLACIFVGCFQTKASVLTKYTISLFLDLLVRWLETIFNPNGGLMVITDHYGSKSRCFFGGPNVPPQQIANLLQTKQQRTQTPILGQGASNFSSLQKNQRAWILWHDGTKGEGHKTRENDPNMIIYLVGGFNPSEKY